MTEQKKENYFDLSKAFNEILHEAVGAKETTVSSLKLLGKGVFNVAKFTATEVVPAVAEAATNHTQRVSKEGLKRDDLSDEQRARLEDAYSKSSESLQARRQAERERRELEDEIEQANADAIRERERADARQHASQQTMAKPGSPEPNAGDSELSENGSAPAVTPMQAPDKPVRKGGLWGAAAVGSSKP